MTPPSVTETGGQPQSTTAAALEELRKNLRGRLSVQPVSPDDLDRFEDIHWAQRDPEVQTRYRGEFVVPLGKRIVAHGTDAKLVLEEAARVTQRPTRELPLVGIIDLSEDTPR